MWIVLTLYGWWCYSQNARLPNFEAHSIMLARQPSSLSLSLSLFPAILSNKQKYLFLIRFTEYAHQSNAIIIGSSWNSLVPIFIHKQTSMRRNENEETHTFICLMNSPLNIISQREMFAIRVLQIHEFGTNLNVIWLLRNWRNHQLENFYRKYSVNFQH